MRAPWWAIWQAIGASAVLAVAGMTWRWFECLDRTGTWFVLAVRGRAARLVEHRRTRARPVLVAMGRVVRRRPGLDVEPEGASRATPGPI